MKTTINKNWLMLPTDRGVQMIDMDSIIRVQAISNYSKLFFADGKTLVVAKVLRWFEMHLQSIYFLRIHRGHLINISFVNSYTNGEGGTVQLKNGDCIDVSKRKKRYFLEYWKAA